MGLTIVSTDNRIMSQKYMRCKSISMIDVVSPVAGNSPKSVRNEITTLSTHIPSSEDRLYGTHSPNKSMFNSRKRLPSSPSGTLKCGPKRKMSFAVVGCIFLLASAAPLFIVILYLHPVATIKDVNFQYAVTSSNKRNIMAASDDEVLEALLHLARMPV